MTDTPRCDETCDFTAPEKLLREAKLMERELAAMTKRADEMERLKEHNGEMFYRIERELADLKAQHAWRPIETAPKDGTWLMLWQQWSDIPFIGRWLHDRWCVSHEHVDAQGGWDGAVVIDSITQKDVTHWQPLPEPPKEGAE